MENLLPAVANIDVTSNDFREAALPYQQWEAKRTQCLLSTPSDIGHLLPPISKTSIKCGHAGTPPPAPPPRTSNASLSHPAPVDRNLSGLYDPALDPSPIGMEERGATQPVRITRIVPSSNPSGYRNQISREESERDGNLTINVTIINRYRGEVRNPGDKPGHEITGTREGMLLWENGKQREDRFDDENDTNRQENEQQVAGVSAVDVFVQGFSNDIQHATLLPSETFRRSLHQRRSMRSPPPHSDLGLFSNVDPEKLVYADCEEEGRDGDPGLTILLASTGDWFGCSEEIAPQHERKIENNHHGDCQSNGTHSEATPRVGSTNGPELQDTEHPVTIHSTANFSLRDKATRIIFQGESRDGEPVLARNAFRVQFEPGPLGMELEEDPLQRGIVQVRRILQASQAEQDGRLSPGFLLVAVGDWDQHPTDSWPSSQERFGTVPGSIVNRNRYTDTSASSDRPGPAPIRSLTDFEKAALHRDSDHLFVVWALDRLAPEAIAALGEPPTMALNGTPRSFEIGPHLVSREWSAPSSHNYAIGKGGAKTDSREKCHIYSNDTAGSERMIIGGRGRRDMSSLEKEGRDEVSVFEQKSTALSTLTVPDVVGSGNHLARTVPEEEARRWEISRYIQGVHIDHHFKHSFSRADEGPTTMSSALAQGVMQNTHGKSGSPRSTDYFLGKRSSDNMPLSQQKSRRGSSIQRREKGAWEFETGGGMFDENDQGLAARRRPHQGDEGSSCNGTREEIEGKRSVLPLGLQASAVDEIAVFIWFCNNHESSVLQVSWINYDGRLIPRRYLEPGEFYFERSFATHPWVLQHHAAMNPNFPPKEPLGRKAGSQQKSEKRAAVGDRDCCVVRLGDAMAVARMTGSVLWSPSNMTLSLIRQAKVGIAGPSICRLSDAGKTAMERAGVAQGKKRLCMAGRERETEETRSTKERARVRGEKLRILDEMRAWRTHPPVDSTAEHGATGGLGKGAPNLRVVMTGSSSESHGMKQSERTSER